MCQNEGFERQVVGLNELERREEGAVLGGFGHHHKGDAHVVRVRRGITSPPRPGTPRVCSSSARHRRLRRGGS